MDTALVALSETGLLMARKLADFFAAKIFAHEKCVLGRGEKSFASILALTPGLFSEFSRIVYFAPVGVVVRAVSGLPGNKHTDPAVVQVDAGGRFAVSLLSGHEGGANDLTWQVARILGAAPVISTATEALKDIVVGIGCQRGVESGHLKKCILGTLGENNIDFKRVRLLATAECKRAEPGLLQAASELKLPFYAVPDSEILRKKKLFDERPLVAAKMGLPGVAEPAAILAGQRAELISARRLWARVSIAIARENFMWSV
ncbi:MAG: cobalamin biosynthesis protein [Thermodesulfobacteriota bacterium]